MKKIDAQTKYPSLFCDTDDIKEQRKSIQKPFSKDEFFPFMVFRPFTIYFSKWISEKTNISANQITIFMAFLSFISPIIIFFIEDIQYFLILSFVLYFLILFLDYIDGEVARLRNKTSKIGEVFDAMLWFYLPVLYIVYIVKLEYFFNFSYLFIFVLLAMATSVMSDILQKMYAKKKYSNDVKKFYDTKTIIIHTVRFFASQSGIFIVAPFVYFLGLNSNILLLYIIISLLLYIINSILRIKNILVDIE
jgi:phosphatidylglycerophosphate synthase